MSCPDGKHDLVAVNGNPLEVSDMPPASEREPAWCRFCGALWRKMPFGIGWGFLHPLSDNGTHTLLNILQDANDTGKSS